MDSNRCHPDYVTAAADWRLMADTLTGERAVKEAGILYLPMTTGQLLNGADGLKNYEAYKQRSIFYGFPSETAKSMLGLMWRENPVISLPDAMETLFEQLTPDGLDVISALRIINTKQIEKGRVGLLLDAKEGTTAKEPPYLAMYDAEAIVNWSSRFENGEEILEFVVLDESGVALVDMEWKEVKLFRVLLLDDGKYTVYTTDKESGISMTPPSDAIVPAIGGTTLERIPFVFVNVSSLDSAPERPPLTDLSNLSLSLYRQEADYRQSLFMQGQGTPTATGVEKNDMENVLLGSMGLLTSNNPAAKFSFMELSGQGLPEMRQAVESLKTACVRLGISFVEQGQTESGTALESRLSTKTANVKTIALTGALAMYTILAMAAEWMGVEYDDETLIVEPNLDFSDENATATDLVSLMGAKNMGAPLSIKSIHAWAAEHGFTELDYDEEVMQINDEGMPFMMQAIPREELPPDEEPPVNEE